MHVRLPDREKEWEERLAEVIERTKREIAECFGVPRRHLGQDKEST